MTNKSCKKNILKKIVENLETVNEEGETSDQPMTKDNPFAHHLLGLKAPVGREGKLSPDRGKLKGVDPDGIYTRKFMELIEECKGLVRNLPTDKQKEVMDIVARYMGIKDGYKDLSLGEIIAFKYVLSIPMTHVEIGYIGMTGLAKLDFDKEPFNKYKDENGNIDYDALADDINDGKIDATPEFNKPVTDSAVYYEVQKAMKKIGGNMKTLKKGVDAAIEEIVANNKDKADEDDEDYISQMTNSYGFEDN